MKHYLPAERRGFTLIELLVVIGILAVLLAITLIAINPARQFSQANNTKRASDVNAILNAVGQYMADNRGALPTGITQYLAALPADPLTNAGAPVTNCAAAYDTGYTIIRSGADNRITVAAPAAELGATISVTR
jgi:prepilin-type N-terminal cleavage/methylation domain-containing protein